MSSCRAMVLVACYTVFYFINILFFSMELKSRWKAIKLKYTIYFKLNGLSIFGPLQMKYINNLVTINQYFFMLIPNNGLKLYIIVNKSHIR